MAQTRRSDGGFDCDCGKPATCYGSYEGRPQYFACDDCCGHGQEDGRCEPVCKPEADESDHDPLSCMDCRMPYAIFPLDSTLPHDEWALIHDSEGGLLCANCMVKRIKERVPGAVAVRMRIARA